MRQLQCQSPESLSDSEIKAIADRAYARAADMLASCQGMRATRGALLVRTAQGRREHRQGEGSQEKCRQGEGSYSADQAKEGERTMQFPTVAGIHDIETHLADGRSVRYTLSVSADAPDDDRRPLILILHYAGTPTRFYGRPLLEYLFEPALRGLAPVCLAPEAICGQWHEEENESFVMQVLDGARAAYGVDPSRVVVGGYSMGALGTWHLIAHYPERFSAALPIAGYPRHDLECTVPVHAFHSAADELFPLAALTESVAALAQAGRPITLTTAAVNGHFDVNGYRDALSAAPAWLRQVWRGAAR